MEPATMAAIATVAAAGIGYMGQQNANQMDRREAEVNRGFQERMRDTSMQSHMKDLNAAGLNPILAAGGSGAAQPAGAQASGMEDPGAQGMASGLSTAMGLLSMEKELDLKEANTDLMHDQASNLVAQRQKTNQEVVGQKINNETSQIQQKLLRETVPAMIKKAKAEGNFAEINQLMGILKSGASTASDVKDLANPLSIKPRK